jgi:hypothetical protein
MLTEVIGDLLPNALGIALSPIPIIAVVVVLGTPRARSQGPAFALGWVLGLTVVSAVVVVAVGASEPPDEPSAALGFVKIAFGALFLLLAVGQWRSLPAPGAEPATPAWMERIDTMGTARTVAVGMGLSGLNPKNLALTVAAAATIGQAALTDASTAVAVTTFIVTGSLTVVGPVVASLVAPVRSAAPLQAIKIFVSAHNSAIMIVVLVLLGAKLVGSGLAAV